VVIAVACSGDSNLLTDGAPGAPDATVGSGDPDAAADTFPDAAPVDRPAPWPIDHPLVLGDFPELPLQASTDEGRNLWVVTSSALYLMRPGQTTFTRYTTADGLRTWPLLSVAGAGIDEVYVGYQGEFGPDDDAYVTDPPELKKSGDLDRIHLKADGTLDVYHFDLHSSDTAETGKYDETRIIVTLLYVHTGRLRGELYVGSSHGVDRVVGDQYADHRHPETITTWPDGTYGMHLGDLQAMALTIGGDLYVGNFYKAARAQWTPVLDEWWQSDLHPWMWADRMFDGAETDKVQFTGIAVTPDGTGYFGSAFHGIMVERDIGRYTRPTLLLPPDPSVQAMAADPDGSVWVGTASALYRYLPTTNAFETWDGQKGLVDGKILHLEVDTTVTPRALVVTGGGQVAVYRGP
jgi:hypothetical protein